MTEIAIEQSDRQKRAWNGLSPYSTEYACAYFKDIGDFIVDTANAVQVIREGRTNHNTTVPNYSSAAAHELLEQHGQPIDPDGYAAMESELVDMVLRAIYTAHDYAELFQHQELARTRFPLPFQIESYASPETPAVA